LHQHETLNAERLAKAYHVLWTMVCLWWAGTSAYGAFIIEPFCTFGGPIGFAFTNVYYASVAHTVFGLIGGVWHLICARMHQQEIDKLCAA
jgi:hypothetical protein